MSSSPNFKFAAVALTYALLATAVPYRRDIQWLQQNGPAAKTLNDHYQSLTLSSTCNDDGEIACVAGQYGVCVQGRYITHACGADSSCAALPNEWSAGTTTICDKNDNIAWRFSQAGISEYKRSMPSNEIQRTDWLKKNGPAAKALNDKYAKLKTTSSCKDGEYACVHGKLGLCHEGKYVTYNCASGETCAALPNEDSEGTTTTCDKKDNIAKLFSEAGISDHKKHRTDWLKKNGPAAKALNDKYAKLNTTSSCKDGEHACVGGKLGLCYKGKYLTYDCASGETCAALPNEDRKGTTTTCDTKDNIAKLFSEAGISDHKRSVSSSETRSNDSDDWLKKNDPAAKALNDNYAKLKTTSSCKDGEHACVGGKLGLCFEGKYLTYDCASDETCAALPNKDNEGMTTTCYAKDTVNATPFSQAGNH